MIPPIHAVASSLRPHFLRLAIIALASAPVLASSGCHFFAGPIAKGPKSATAMHAAASPIVVQTRNGSVQIIADASRSDVGVDATVTCSGATQQEADQRLAQASLELSRDTSRTLTIKPIFPGGPQGNDGASLIIRVPDADGIDVQTSNGSVILTSLKGAIKVKTSNASVNVSDHAGPAELHSSNGAITIRDLAGDLKAVTSNASVTASGVKGRAIVDTSNGSITIELDSTAAGPLDLDTSNASISVTVGESFKGDVALNTSNGKVTVSGDRAKSARTGNQDATVFLGEGEQSIVKTSNGNISFAVVK